MKICDELRQAVLQAAIQGKLTRQRKEDGDARDLLKQIAEEKAKLIKEKKIKKEKPLPEITEDEVPFDIPENWVWVRLNQIVSVLGDGIHGTPEYDVLGNIGFINGNNLRNGKVVITNNTKFVNDAEAKKHYRELNSKTVLVSINGTIGNIAFYNNEKIILGKSACYFNLINEKSKYYLKLLLGTGYFLKYATTSATGTTIKNVPLMAMRNFIVPLPPLAEQQRIVAKVDKLMAEIDEMEKVENELIALKEAFPGDMKAALLQASMQGKLTTQRKEDGNAKELLKRITEEKARLVKEGKLKKEKPLAEISEDEIPFDIPENWEWVRLGKCGSFVRGSGIKKDEVTEEGWPCVRYGQLYTTYHTCFEKAVSKTMKSVFDKCQKAVKGDILMALTGENEYDIALAVMYQGDETVAIGGDMTRLTPYYINPMYLTLVLNSSYGIECKSLLATGNIIVHISNDKLASIPIPLPPLAEQERIVAKLDKLLPLCDSLL